MLRIIFPICGCLGLFWSSLASADTVPMSWKETWNSTDKRDSRHLSGLTSPADSRDEVADTESQQISGLGAVDSGQTSPFDQPSFPPIEETFPHPLSSEWQWLPQGVLYHTYWASAAEPRMSANLVDINGQSGPYVNSSIGGRLPLLRFGDPERTEEWQFDVLGGAKLRQNTGDEWDVVTVDFRYDLLLTRASGPHRWKFGFYHVSAHLGDEYLLKHSQGVRLNFLRDTLVVGYSAYPTPELRLYGEVGYAFNCDISQPFELQFGFDYGPSERTGSRGAPFVAMNGHLREELGYGGNVAIQVGWAWRTEGSKAGTFRTGLYAYDGKSPQFSFYNRYERQAGWGIWYDY